MYCSQPYPMDSRLHQPSVVLVWPATIANSMVCPTPSFNTFPSILPLFLDFSPTVRSAFPCLGSSECHQLQPLFSLTEPLPVIVFPRLRPSLVSHSYLPISLPRLPTVILILRAPDPFPLFRSVFGLYSSIYCI